MNPSVKDEIDNALRRFTEIGLSEVQQSSSIQQGEKTIFI